MLVNDFFFIDKIEHTPEGLRALLRLQKDHRIFEGHFPNLPVVPGVCMMQIVKEVLETVEGTAKRIAESSNIKFLSVLNPKENELVDLLISVDERSGSSLMKISATMVGGSITFFKMKATLKSI